MSTDNRKGGRFNHRQQAVLAAGIVPRTLYRWRDEPLLGRQCGDYLFL